MASNETELDELRLAVEYVRNNEVYVAALKAIDDLDARLRSDAELRKVATNALEWLDAEISARRCYGHDQPTHCVECDLRYKALKVAEPLRDALNPSHLPKETQ